MKKKIRECYPELSGIQMNLVKFDNRFTEMLESMEKCGMEKKTLEPEQGEEHPEEDGNSDALEFASAEDTGLQDDLVDEEMQDAAEEEDDTVTPEEGNDDGSGEEDIFIKGCWIKLEIHYQELTENQKVVYPVTVTAGSVRMEFGDDTVSMEEVRKRWIDAHPEYEGCLFHYDDKQNLLIPFVRGESEIKGKNIGSR